MRAQVAKAVTNLVESRAADMEFMPVVISRGHKLPREWWLLFPEGQILNEKPLDATGDRCVHVMECYGIE